ncbi:MAG TPA: hypothetical protein VN081_03570 [Dongiaceae bacterium]|nr:hypothetical protein [Dongiaceae bacterium]
MMASHGSEATLTREFAVPRSETEPVTQPNELPRNTEEVVIPGYDIVEQKEPQAEASGELLRVIHASLDDLNYYLMGRVRNDLIAQLYTSDREKNPAGYINLEDIRTSLQTVLEDRRNTEASMAETIKRKVIPSANRFAEPDFTTYREYKYSRKDIPELEIHADAHHFMDSHIQGMLATGEDGLRDLAEHYIAETYDDARDTAMELIVAKKAELEKEDQRNKKRIAELEETIRRLGGEIEERDFELWEGDVETDIDQAVVAHARHIVE